MMQSFSSKTNLLSYHILTCRVVNNVKPLQKTLLVCNNSVEE